VNKRKENKSGKLKEYFVKAFQLPDDCILGNTYMIMTGKTGIFIENYRSIIEYTDSSLKLQGKNGKIFITGKSIYIEAYDSDKMKVKGIFQEIKYF